MTGRGVVATVLVAGLLAVGCEPAGEGGGPALTSSPSRTGGPSTTPPRSPTSSPDDPGDPATPRFHASVSPIDPAIAERMSASWRPGCPVPLEDLRYLTLSHWGFDGAVHQGELVVHRDAAADVVRAFRQVFRARFPIRRMALVDDYGADDDASMAANNTSAFNCRAATGSDEWSEHAYGRAIDINPVQNPYVTSSVVLPPAGARFVDRSLDEPGMIHDGDAVVRAFAAIGWGWGGHWSSLKDYQHVSATGR